LLERGVEAKGIGFVEKQIHRLWTDTGTREIDRERETENIRLLAGDILAPNNTQAVKVLILNFISRLK
jgi:hypothetical protein